MPTPLATTTLPFEIYKTNLALQARIIKLLQANSSEWLEIGYHMAKDQLAESGNEIEALLKAGDWQKLAALTAESVSRTSQKHLVDDQALGQSILRTQTAFAQGLQEAIQTWQKEASALFGGLPTAAPFADFAWNDLFKPWEKITSSLAAAAAKSASAKDAK